MNLVNESALMRPGAASAWSPCEFEDAKDKIMMGAERKTLAMSEKKRKLTAITRPPCHRRPQRARRHSRAQGDDHSRGRALGMVQVPARRRPLLHEVQEYTSQLAVAMAARGGKKMIFGHENVTSGAVRDIDQATRWHAPW